MNGVLGSGSLGGVVEDLVLGQTGMNGSLLREAADNVAGRWYDKGHQLWIYTWTQKNVYKVVDNYGNTKLMGLNPITDFLRTQPARTTVVSYKPCYHSMAETLAWEANTTTGTYVIHPVTGAWIKK